MTIEIERKFLLRNDNWRSTVHQAIRIAQGYLNTDPERTVRVRIKGSQGFLTIKGKSEHISRVEFEYEIPVPDAEALLMLCPQVLDKTRHLLEFGGFTWEIDEFHGDNTGLLVAEIELPTETTEFTKPDWLSHEVSTDLRYFNSALSKYPYKNWSVP